MLARGRRATSWRSCRAAKVERSCRPAVRMMESAENRSTDDDTVRHWRTWHWRRQLKRPVGTILVVIAHELGEQREQMLLTQHDDVVKTLLAKGPHYPLRNRVR